MKSITQLIILLSVSPMVLLALFQFFLCLPPPPPSLISLVAGEIDSGVVWFLESQSRLVIPESTETDRHFSGPRYPAASVCHGVNITGTKVCGNDSQMFVFLHQCTHTLQQNGHFILLNNIKDIGDFSRNKDLEHIGF